MAADRTPAARAVRRAASWAPPPGRPPERAQLVWQRALAAVGSSAEHDRFAVALDLLRAAHHSPATMLHALTLGTSRLRTHPGDARARGGVAVLDAAIAFLGVKPRAGEIALADR
ncbi:MAG TPA: hypothetical protein VFA83_06645 [Acidimicrobiales bacterium]|nr:hypothetical protein [Acidimicrobiales bacterium]